MLPALLEVFYSLTTVILLGYFIVVSNRESWGKLKEIKWWALFGFLFNFLSFTWLYTVYPLIWLPEGPVQIVGILLLHLILSTICGTAFILTGYAFYRARSIGKHWKPFIIASAFTLTEMLRSLFISALYYGKGTTVDLHFNAGTIGNALSVTPLIEFAYYGGTFALTFVLTYLIYSLLSLSLKEVAPHYLVVASIFLITHFFIPLKAPNKNLSIGVVTSYIPTLPDDILVEKRKENNKALALLILQDKSKKDIIILPEDSRFLSSLTEGDRGKLKTGKRGTLIVDGETITYNEKLANISLFYEAGKDKSYWRGKEFLLPFNEYVPYFFSMIFGFFIGDELEAYQSRHTYTKVPSGKTFLFETTRVGTLICSEILSFRMIERLGREAPQVVFFQSRLNVFNNNPLFLMHLRSFSKVAAAQLRTPVVSSGNYAPSYLVNGRGEVVATMPVANAYREVVITTKGEVILK